MSVRERAEHLITLADAAESYDKGHWSQSVVNREWAKVGTEAVWVARQLLEALNRIEAASSLHHRVGLPPTGPHRGYCLCGTLWPCPTWLVLNPKEEQ